MFYFQSKIINILKNNKKRIIKKWKIILIENFFIPKVNFFCIIKFSVKLDLICIKRKRLMSRAAKNLTFFG